MAKDLLTTSKIKGFVKNHDEKQAAEDAEAKQEARSPKRIVSSVSDGSGLKLEARGTGNPRWVLRYTRPLTGKKNEYAIGTYPDIALAKARDLASELRGKVQEGIDPAVAKIEEVKEAKAEAAKIERTFGVLLEEFRATKYRDLAASTIEKNESRIANHIGKLLPMALEEITPRMLLDEILRPINAPDTQARVKQLIGQVFKFAIASGDIYTNPASDIGAALPRHRRKHFAAVTTIKELQKIWIAIESVESTTTRCALQLQFLLFQRPGNTRSMEWNEIDLQKKIWTIPAAKMKLMKDDKEDDAKEHRVPLPVLALEILSRVPKKSEKYVFPISINKNRVLPRPISDATMTAGLRGVGITQEITTCHGARTAADSILNESNLFNPDAIERLLAHKLHGGEVRNAYNRADFWDERVKIMTWWGELFESFTSTN